MPATTKVVGWRVAAWIIDLIPGIVLFVVGVRTFGQERAVSLFDETTNGASINATLSFGDTEYAATGADALKVYALVLAWGLLNSVLLQGLTGGSVGKQLLGLRDVRPDGQVCGVGKALVRWLLLTVDAFPYFVPLVGFIMALSTKGNRRLGDMAANTYVVRAAHLGQPVQVEGQTGSYGGYGQPAQGYGQPAQGYGQPPAAGGYGAPPPAPPGEPQWDAARAAWVRWDGQVWLQHDTTADTWGPLR